MAGDLEDFLRRAAERRKAKAGQAPQPQKPAPQRQQQPPQRQPPPAQRQQSEYIDRRTERIARPEPEPILVAEVVDEEHVASLSKRKRKLEEAKKAAEKAQAEAAARARSVGSTTSTRSSGAAPAMTGDLAADLISMLRTPGGIQRGILLSEILDRPEHRW